MKDEVFIGGVESGKLQKGMLRGYGIYGTSRRLMGARKVARAVRAGLLTDYGEWVTSKKKSAVLLERLEGMKKDFEVQEEDTSEIEMKKPSVLWGGGYLRIMTKDGEGIKVTIGSGTVKDLERLKQIVSKFKLEALKLAQRFSHCA